MTLLLRQPRAGDRARPLSLHDIPAVIVTPDDAPAVEACGDGRAMAPTSSPMTATRSAGSDIGERLGEQRGLTLIPPFDHRDVMAGQGTLAMELVTTGPAGHARRSASAEAAPISGCATVAAATGPGPAPSGSSPRPATTSSSHWSRAASSNSPTRHEPSPTASRRAKRQARTPFRWIRGRGSTRSSLVTDEEIVAAMRLAFHRLNVVVEPSGASALAAVLSGAVGRDGAAGGHHTFRAATSTSIGSGQ